jgi:cysteinyl-tRNA synthetase
MSDLKLFNSLTRQLETFQPVHPGEARVYSCGPTVYNYPHIGNMRAYVFADTLGRVLSYKGYKLTHIINITDVGHLTDDADAGEDKMEKMAAEKAQSIWDIARHYTEAYWADIKRAQHPPAGQMVDRHRLCAADDRVREKHCRQALLRAGKRALFRYLDRCQLWPLARAQTDEGEGRIEHVEGKRHAADFAIWRKTPRAKSARWNGTAPGAAARRAGTWNAR